GGGGWGGGGEVWGCRGDGGGGRVGELGSVCAGGGGGGTRALTAVAPGGTVLFFAPSTPDTRFTVPFNDLFWRTDLTLRTSYGASPADYESALQLIQTGRVVVRDMVTHRLGLSEAAAGFRMAAEADESLKILLD